jgi:SH3-like domain-containing protein
MERKMKSAARCLVILTGVFAFTMHPVFGKDVVNLTNGKSLTGTIIEETDTEVRLLIDDIEIPLNRRNIVSIVRDGVLHPVKASDEEPKPSSEQLNPTPLHLRTPTPTPPGIQPAVESATEFPFPGKEPLIPTLLPLDRFRLVTGKVVNFRSGPGTTLSIIEALPRGTVLMELEEEDYWLRCRTQEGKEGWIASEFTRKVDAQVAAATATPFLNMRAGPSADQAVIGKLNRGKLVIVVDEQGDWSHVRTLEGKYGWASSRYLQILTDLRGIRPAIAEMSSAAADSFLEKGFSSTWTASEGGWKHLSMNIGNDVLVRNGVVVLLLLWGEAEEGEKEADEVLRSESLVWQERFNSQSSMEDLGFSLGLVQTTRSVLVAYVQGERGETGWELEVDVKEAAIPGCRFGLVVQEGLQRGAIAVFEP